MSVVIDPAVLLKQVESTQKEIQDCVDKGGLSSREKTRMEKLFHKLDDLRGELLHNPQSVSNRIESRLKREQNYRTVRTEVKPVPQQVVSGVPNQTRGWTNHGGKMVVGDINLPPYVPQPPVLPATPIPQGFQPTLGFQMDRYELEARAKAYVDSIRDKVRPEYRTPQVAQAEIAALLENRVNPSDRQYVNDLAYLMVNKGMLNLLYRNQ